MGTLGAFIMGLGFVLGIFGGLTLSRSSVIIEDGKVNQKKQLLLAFYVGGCAISMVVGFLLYFGGL